LKFIVTMADGREIDLPQDQYAVNSGHIGAALRGKNFVCDSHQMAPGCDSPWLTES
jgi:hypothetical protein